jgi:hypothetical protein
MPTYDLKCTKCEVIYEAKLTFAEYDEIKLKDESFVINCPICQNMKAIRIYDTCAHGHVVNSNIVGIHAEKNTKKIGKTKIEEIVAKKKESIAPKAKPAWYGRLPEDKKKDLTNSRKSTAERKKIATKYVLEGK